MKLLVLFTVIFSLSSGVLFSHSNLSLKVCFMFCDSYNRVEFVQSYVYSILLLKLVYVLTIVSTYYIP